MSANSRGYTVVELMMALAVLAVSVSGVLAMQKVTAASNMNARDVAVANRIGQTWIEQLHADARLWNHPSNGNPDSDLDETAWLDRVGSGFFRPAWNEDRQIGATFDGLGRPVDNHDHAVFCVHVELTELMAASQSDRGEMRATVRVFWPRAATPSLFCEEGEDPGSTNSDGVGHRDSLSEFHFVYHTTVVRQHKAQ